MSIKKMLLLASMALAAAAFAVPATASANQLTFTDWNGTEHKHVGSGEHFVDTYEGFLFITTPAIPPLGIPHSKFGCEVTVAITTTGPTTGKVLEYSPTTTECEGEGPLKECHLIEDETNLGMTTWTVNVLTNVLQVKRHTGNVTFRNTYTAESEACKAESSHLEFAEIKLTPDLNSEGTIETLTFSGTATNGVTKTTGTLHVEESPTLGLT